MVSACVIDEGSVDAGPSPVDGGGDDAGRGGDGGAACEPEPMRYDLHDVSFLFPLPARFSLKNQLLDLQTPFKRGPLLPPALEAQLPAPLNFIGNAALADFRVVAARVDPCFPTSDGVGCARQIRLVAQPLLAAGEDPNRLVAFDTTLHLFFTLSEAEFDGALRDALDALKTLAGAQTRCRPLGVHPVMQQQGLDGAYAMMLKALITDFCGASSLSRIAVMRLTAGQTWEFSALDVVNGRLVVDPIARLPLDDNLVQKFDIGDVIPGADPSVRSAAITPLPSGNQLNTLLDYQRLSTVDAALIQEAVDESFAVENPLLETPRSVDCVSCHIAQRGRERAQRYRGISTASGSQAYGGGRFDVTVPSIPLAFSTQRAFGYHSRQPAMSPRTANESAEVAKWFGTARN